MAYKPTVVARGVGCHLEEFGKVTTIMPESTKTAPSGAVGFLGGSRRPLGAFLRRF